MNKQTLEYFEWNDIRLEICKEMGIDVKYFRYYNNLIGGEYKDLWHIWLDYFQSDVYNDTIVANDCDERIEVKIEWLIEEDKQWALPFVEAVYKVWERFGIEYIRYSW
jgi:hypothetical protein